MLQTLMPSLKELITTDYKSIKTPETERLIAGILQGFQPVPSPLLRQVSGIPGAGKSTYCTAHLPPNFLFLSFDKIMMSMPSYQKDVAVSGLVTAYKNNEMPARVIGYELLNRALERRLNIMFEHSGTNQAHLELFKNIRRYGYRTEVDFIVCDTEVAIKRANARAEKIRRYVPESLIRERAENTQGYIAAYQKMCDKITLLDGKNNFKECFSDNDKMFPLKEI